MSAPSPDAVREAMAWLADLEITGRTDWMRAHARTIQALLAEPRMPESLTTDQVMAMDRAFVPVFNKGGTQVDAMLAAYRALRAELSKPATKTIAKWIVTYWSTAQRMTVSTVADCEEAADRIMSGKGPTARKHRVEVEEWQQTREVSA